MRRIGLLNLTVVILWISAAIVSCSDRRDITAELSPPQFYLQPVFTDSSTSTSAIAAPGSSRTLQCRANGIPRPKYFWLKNGLRVNQQALEDGDWRIDQVSEVHSGIYRCVAENPCGSVLSQDLELHVAHISQFESSSEPARRVRRGDAIVLPPPFISSTPNASLSWLADDLPISGRANNRKFILIGDNSLAILDADLGDNKQFRVEAYNSLLGETRTSQSISVIVEDMPVELQLAPRVLLPPRNVTVKQGDLQAIFECIVNARPLPDLRMIWRGGKDRKTLQSDGINYLITPDGHRLTILNPNLSHEGMYECFAELPAVGSTSSSAFLSVGVVPVIVQRPELETRADLGQTAVILCAVRGKPTPITSWYKNAQLLETTGETNKFIMHENGSLSILKTLHEDGGMYQCIAQNVFGDESVSTWLRIKNSPPQIIEQLSSVAVLENQAVRLPCSVSGSPAPTVQWYLNGSTVPTVSSNYQIDVSGDLLVSFASRAMTGTYYCVAKNAEGSTNRSVTLTVTERTRISQPPRDTRLVIGSKVSFTCGVSKDPGVKADIQWYQDGRLLDSATRTSRRQVLSDGTLEIVSARSSDIGVYTCRVSSSGGNDSQSARLDVIELPYAPRIRAELISGTKSVNVSWVPDFDGNAPIIRFVLQFKQISDVMDVTASMDIGWQTLLSNFSATDRFFIVKDLKPSASYQFRVTAVNNVGEGSPSLASPPILLPQTPPTSAPKVSASSRNATAIMIQWQPPAESEWNGILKGYVVRYKLAGYNDLAWTEVPIHQEARRNFILDDLIAWKLYEIQMAAFNDKGTGVWSDSTRVKTQEGVPEAAPTDVLATSLSSTSLSVSWRPPDPQQINGVNQGYRVEVWDAITNHTADKPWTSVEVPPSPYDPLERQSAKFDNLKKFRKYAVTALCFTGAGAGPRSVPVSVVTLEDLPGAVQSLHIFNIRDRSLDMTWEAPDSPNGRITNYTVECSQLDSVSNATVAVRTFQLDADVKRFMVDELLPQTNYMIRVFASTRIGAGDGRMARIRSSVPPTLPCAPVNLQIVDIRSTIVTVRFDPVCDGNTSILQVNMDVQTRDMKPDEWQRLFEEKNNTNVSLLELRNLRPFVEYRVRLSMENVVGKSAPSLPSDWFQMLPDSPSNAPGNLTLRAINATAIRCRWTPLVTNQWNGKPGSYQIMFRSLNDSSRMHTYRNITVNDSSSGSAVLAGLDEFTTFEARIVANNAVGSSEKSEKVVEATRESVPGVAPESVVAHGIGSTMIIVNWRNISAADHNGILLGYRVFYTTGSALQVLDVSDAGTFSTTLTNLEKYKEYSVQVAGYTRMGVGRKSSPVIERTLEDFPERPYNVFFPEAAPDHVRITWEPPLRPNGQILGYRISYRLEGGMDDISSAFLPPQTRSYIAGGLAADQIYWFTLSANTSVGWGNSLEVVVKTTALLRDRPERPGKAGVSVSLIQSRSLSVSWLPGRRDDNSPVRYYQLQYAESSNVVWKSVPEKTDWKTTSYSVQGLSPSTGYKFRVQAINDAGASEWSDESDIAQTAEDVPEFPPYGFTAIPYTTSSLTLSWRPLPATAANGVLTGYTVQFHRVLPGMSLASGSFEEITVKPNVTTCNLTDLIRDTNYELRVAALTAIGAGPMSPPLTVYVGEAVPLGIPAQLKIETSSATSATVTWRTPESSSDQNNPLTGFKILYLDLLRSVEGVDFVEPNVARHTVRRLNPFTSYSISILTFNSAGDGPSTAAINITTLESVPDAPESITFSNIQLSQLSVTWVPPKQRNGVLLSYEISYQLLPPNSGKTGGRKTAGPEDTSIVVVGLEELASYSFSVRANTALGFGNTTTGNVTTGPQPGSPTQLMQLSVQLVETAVSLRWVNGNNGDAPVVGYLIQGKRDDSLSSFDTVEIVKGGLVDSCQISYLNLVPSSRYSFRVMAYNRFGVSLPSNLSSAVQTPDWNSVVAMAPKKPFYLEIWFLILVAASGSVIVIFLVACLCIKSKAAKYRSEVEKVISTADILQFPEDDEFAAPTAFELRQSMRRSTRKPQNNVNSNLYSASAAASMRRKNVLTNTSRAPPFTIAQLPVGIVPSIAYSDVGDASDIYPPQPIYPPQINRGFINEDDLRERSTAGTSRASSSLTDKPSELLNESSTDEVDDDSADAVSKAEEPDPQSSSFVNHYANLNNTLRRPWAESVGTNESRRSRLPQAPPPEPVYRRSTATSISASIADSDATSVSLNGQLININNKPGSRNPLPGFSSFV